MSPSGTSSSVSYQRHQLFRRQAAMPQLPGGDLRSDLSACNIIGAMDSRESIRTNHEATSRKKKQRRAGGVASILSTKRQGSNLLFANQVIWGTSADVGL
jgi:hypothetical protein